MISRKTFNTALLTALLGVSAAAGAQPEQPIKILVGFPPGGAADTIGRLLGEGLATELKQPVIVDNRPGAGGRVAMLALKASAPDGLTYLIGPHATPLFSTLLYPADVLKYDVFTDFAPVAMLVSYPMALVVSENTGIKTAGDFAAWVKAHPGQASFGSAGLGAHTHFSGMQLGKAIGANLQVVPYRGNGPLIADLLGGQIAAGIMPAGDIRPHLASGKVRVVGLLGARRSPLLPDVPTIKEQGIDVDTGDGWIGMWAPAKTPQDQLVRMQNALRQVLARPEVRDILTNKVAFTPDFHPAEEMDAQLRKDLAHWEPVIKASGFTPEQ
jgi:tripartite-type tricarboxylate transporter receptor subunit TctC